MINFKRIISIFGLLTILSIGGQAQIRYGQQVDEIELPSINGDIIKLSSLKGKVVLLDFWASWCGPCRVSNKFLVKLYEKYKSKGFEIFGVSLDNNEKEWERAVKKDKITWLQVIDNKKWEGKTAVKWNISQIPTSYLIDKQGKLVAMDPEGKKLESMLKELLN